MKFSLWANLYPSSAAPHYGTFVRAAYLAWEQILGAEHTNRCVIDRPASSSIGKLQRYSWLYFRCLRDALIRRPQLVEVHYPFFFIPLLFLLPRSGIILRFHGSDLEKLLDSRLMMHAFRVAAPRLLCIVVPSCYYQRRIVEELRFTGRVLVIAPDAVSDFFYPRSELAISDGDFIVGVVGRLKEDKNYQEVIEALALLDDDRIRLLIVGGGPYRQALIELARKRGVDGQVEWVGPVARDTLVHHLHKMSVFVFSSKRTAESFGLVCLEALACGVPVVARSSLQGAREYLDNGNALFYADSAFALAKALREYLDLPESKKAMMSRNALQVASQFNYDDVVLGGVERLLDLHAKAHS